MAERDLSCKCYVIPSERPSTYINDALIINNKPYKIPSSSLYLNYKSSFNTIINNNNEGIKHSSYERYLHKKKSNLN